VCKETKNLIITRVCFHKDKAYKCPKAANGAKKIKGEGTNRNQKGGKRTYINFARRSIGSGKKDEVRFLANTNTTYVKGTGI